MIKLEIIQHDDNTELRYFQDLDNIRYRRWNIPLHIIEDLKEWWHSIKNKEIKYPITVKRKSCEYHMTSKKYLYIREISDRGFYKIIGWYISSILIDNLLEMLQDNISETVIKISL